METANSRCEAESRTTMARKQAGLHLHDIVLDGKRSVVLALAQHELDICGCDGVVGLASTGAGISETDLAVICNVSDVWLLLFVFPKNSTKSVHERLYEHRYCRWRGGRRSETCGRCQSNIRIRSVGRCNLWKIRRVFLWT